MASFSNPAQFVIRVEFHGAKTAPDVCDIFHKELAENIFHDQYFNHNTKAWYDLPRATYYAQGPSRNKRYLATPKM